MPAPFLAPSMHKFSAVVQVIHFLGAIYDKLALNFFKKYAETAPSNGSICDKFSEQH